MSSRTAQSLSLELEEQRVGSVPSFVSYMGSGQGESSRMPMAMAIRDHEQQQQQYRMASPYDVVSSSSPNNTRQNQQQQQQQHLLHEGGSGIFWPRPPHFASAHAAASAMPSYLQREFRQQEQQAAQEDHMGIPKLPRSLSSASSRGEQESGIMEMGLNIRGMNVIPLAHHHHHQQQQQRPITPVVVNFDQEQQHQLQIQQIQQQFQTLQQQRSQQQQQQVSIASLQRGGPTPSSIVGHLQQHIHQQQQQHQHDQAIQLQQQMHLMTSSSSTASGGSTCKECGNQAKKDCTFQRCRTCCKSRGFECQTHVRSTWVPAAKRRERQIAEAAAIASGQPRPKSKRNRAIAMQQQQENQQQQEHLGAQDSQQQQQQLSHQHHEQLLHGTTHHQHASASAAHMLMMDEDITAVTPATTTTSNSPHSDARQSQPDLGSLPSEVRAQAVFKCVKVTRVDNGEDEYAYQAVVRIGGRVFKGVLQDQGSDSMSGGDPDTSSMGDLQLGAGSGTLAETRATAASIDTPPQLLQALDPARTPTPTPGGAGSSGGLFGSSSAGPSL